MAILWCGGEDVDFPSGGGTRSTSTTSTNFRSAYSRLGLYNSVGAAVTILQSLQIPAGPVTSAWLTFQINVVSSNVGTSRMYGGVALSGGSKGLFVGNDSSSVSKVTLCKSDGTTRTQLAAETGTSLSLNTMHKVDMQITSYGASATVNIYVDAVLVLTFTGDVTVTGMSNFDTVAIGGHSAIGQAPHSEFILSTTDTRTLPGLQTLVLTGTGTTSNWANNSFANIGNATFSVGDAAPTSSNTNNQVQDYNVTDPGAGTYAVAGIKIAMRGEKSGAGVTRVKLGYNDGSGNSGSGTGATKTLTTSFATYEQLDLTSPMTGLVWSLGNQTALQLEMTALT